MNTSTLKKDQPQQNVDEARKAAGQAADKAREGLAGAASSAREAVSHVGEAVSNVASSAASTVGQKAEQAVNATGRGIETLADTVREHGPEQGVLGSATRSVADTLDSTGHYLEDRNLSGMFDDMTTVIKRNPIPAVLIGLGVGFLLGRSLRS
jgi:ElaB/YqjD/DUF883 family membrane-anchored ribosome-binding protein